MNAAHRLRDRGTGMSVTVKTVTRWLKGPILLFGIYMVLYGHITPGGGFGGGVVIASAFILITLATGERSGLKVLSKGAASRFDSVGLLLFLVLGWLGTWWAGAISSKILSAHPRRHSIRFSVVDSSPLETLHWGLKLPVRYSSCSLS